MSKDESEHPRLEESLLNEEQISIIHIIVNIFEDVLSLC